MQIRVVMLGAVTSSFNTSSIALQIFDSTNESQGIRLCKSISIPSFKLWLIQVMPVGLRWRSSGGTGGSVPRCLNTSPQKFMS